MDAEYIDSIQYAAQLGRLDFISALLAALGIIMVFGGLFAFINIRSKAEQAAEEIATAKAEEVANIYLQNSLPMIIEAYDDFIENHVNASLANQIAEAQERNENDK